jgi:elongation factor Ts
MAVSIELIKELRVLTLASVSDCRVALDEAKGDMKLAAELLKKRGLEIAAKKASRATKNGRIESYVHLGNKIGAMAEIDCETDFVARNEEFMRFCKDVVMQIAAAEPKYLKSEDVPVETLARFTEQEKNDFYKVHCLIHQPFIKDPKVTIQDYLTSVVAKIGENIVIRRFSRFKIGEDEK